MKLIFKIGLIFLIFGATVEEAGADQREYTKTIKKEFAIDPNGTTSITNKYGKIDIKTWNRNRVKIDVTILVKARSESGAQEVFDRIDISFSNTPDYVKAATAIEPRKRGFWDWGDDDKADYAINYEVFLPESNSLEIDHKYGDVVVAQITGKADINIKYANIRMEGVGDNSRIDLAYGNGSLDKARDLNLDVAYAKVFFNQVEDIFVNSKYTQVTVREAKDIQSETKYDDYELGVIRDFTNRGKYDNIEIESAQHVKASAKYTQIRVREVGKSLDLDMEYGGAATGLAAQFNRANLVGKYTDFKINLERGMALSVDAAATYAGIQYPRGMEITYEVDKGSSHEVKGYLGRSNGGAVVKARLSYGGLKLRQN